MEIDEVERQLRINKHRQEIIDALLLLREHSNLVQTIKALSVNPVQEFMDRFQLNRMQASALMDLRQPIFDIPKEKIIEEKLNLKKIEIELKSNLS
jgi:hypothetical protein